MTGSSSSAAAAGAASTTMRERKSKASLSSQQQQKEEATQAYPHGKARAVTTSNDTKTSVKKKSKTTSSSSKSSRRGSITLGCNNINNITEQLPLYLRQRRELSYILALLSFLVCVTALIRFNNDGQLIGSTNENHRGLSLQPQQQQSKPRTLSKKKKRKKKKNALQSQNAHASWPFTLKDHPEQFETIVHPGDNRTQMAVPTFWSPPIHNQELMTRELAMQVGICAEPRAKSSSTSSWWWPSNALQHHRYASKNPYIRGDDCPPDQRTIYVAIASYRDFQCRETVEELLQRATFPHRIRVGVVDQIVDGIDVACDTPLENCDTHPQQALCVYKNQVDVLEVEAPLSLGPTFARNLGHRMYRGEYYVVQTDAHVSFVKGWDEDLIQQFTATNNEMAVLTTYLSDIRGSLDEEGHSLKTDRPIMCNSAFVDDDEDIGTPAFIRHTTQPDSEPKIAGMPQLEPWWAAGFSFSRGHFVVNVPYDGYQQMIFQGEEMSISIRGFSVGYDYYAPERSVCFHYYERKDPKIKYFGENEKNNWYSDGMYVSAMKRLLSIVQMAPEVTPQEWDHRDEERYGLGGVRTPTKFYDLYGIDIENKHNEGHLCRFVDAEKSEETMHAKFTPFLREDGMGIDYSKINFQFKDPAPGENDDDDGTEEEDGSEDGEEEDSEEEEEEDASNSEENDDGNAGDSEEE